MWGNITPEQVQAWLAASGQATTPVVIKPVQMRCDSCKRFLGKLETIVSYNSLYSHLTEKCLSKFAEKHLQNVDLTKVPPPVVEPGTI